jgi:hypothetical protein
MTPEQLKRYEALCNAARLKSQPPITVVTEAMKKANHLLASSLARPMPAAPVCRFVFVSDTSKVPR